MNTPYANPCHYVAWETAARAAESARKVVYSRALVEAERAAVASMPDYRRLARAYRRPGRSVTEAVQAIAAYQMAMCAWHRTCRALENKRLPS